MFDLNQGDVIDLGIAGEPVYADGVASVRNLGSTFQTDYFCWMKPNGVWLRVVRLQIIRPRDSVPPDGSFDRALANMAGPVPQMMLH